MKGPVSPETDQVSLMKGSTVLSLFEDGFCSRSSAGSVFDSLTYYAWCQVFKKKKKFEKYRDDTAMGQKCNNPPSLCY